MSSGSAGTAALAVPNSGNTSSSGSVTSAASAASSMPVALAMKKSMDDLLTGSQEVLASVVQRTPSPVRKKLVLSDACPIGVEVTEASPGTPPDRLELNLTRSPSSNDERLFPSPSSEKEPSESGDFPHFGSRREKKEKHKPNMAEKAKKKAWYSVLYPSYKSRTEEFKKLFKEVPDDDRLIGDYSCAIQKDILVHGRLYVSQYYICFHANLLVYETKLVLRMKDVTAIVKDKTARVIPNAISVFTETEKYFFTSFTSRDKTYLILFRVWQNALMDTPMNPQELWQQVHKCYGDELGLTTDDEDYIDPYDATLHAACVDAKLSAAESGSGDLISDVTGNSSSKDKSSGSSGCGPHIGDKIIRKPTTLKLNAAKKQFINMKRSDLSPVEQIPTDMSDTSDSDTGTNIETSTLEQVECDSKHEGRQLVHTILPINVETLFGLLFSNSKFFTDFHESRRTQNLDLGSWEVNADGLKERQVKLTVAINQAVGPKNSHITELQNLRPCSKDGSLYAVDIESTNAGIPYADSFAVMIHYCMQRTQDDHTVLSVHAHIHYKKSVWGFVKGFIEKNTWAGLEEFFQALLKALQSEYCIPPARTRARKTRRANGFSSTKGSLTESPALHKETSPLRAYDIPTVLAGDKIKHEKLFSWIVIVMMVALVVINIFLYYKLRGLEEIADSVDASDYILKYTTKNGNPPVTESDWLSLLQQQEIYHAKEVQQWHNLLQSSVEMLRKIETTLTEVQQLMHVKKGGGIGGGASAGSLHNLIVGIQEFAAKYRISLELLEDMIFAHLDKKTDNLWSKNYGKIASF